MEDDRIKARIGTNIAERRKRAGLTQAGLAERLNYSDKAISKWERGESVPDVLTMMQLAELFGVRVDDLLQDPALSGSLLAEEPKKPLASKRVIQALSSTLVWFVALFFFVVISSFGIPSSWVAFFYAIPANAIVLLCLRSAWHKYSWNKVLISVIVWGSLASIYVSLRVFLDANVWKVFLLGIPGQVAISLWFRMFQSKEERSEETDGE